MNQVAACYCAASPHIRLVAKPWVRHDSDTLQSYRRPWGWLEDVKIGGGCLQCRRYLLPTCLALKFSVRAGGATTDVHHLSSPNGTSNTTNCLSIARHNAYSRKEVPCVHRYVESHPREPRIGARTIANRRPLTAKPMWPFYVSGTSRISDR